MPSLRIKSVLAPCVILLVLVVSCEKKTNPPVVTPPAVDSVAIGLKKGLLLYLPFTGNIADSSGNNNSTSMMNGPVLTYDEHGYANSAFGATGAGQRVLVTNNGSIKFDTAFSISFDFMIRSNSGLQAFLSMVDWNTGHGPTWILGTTSPGLSNLMFNVDDVLAGDCNNFGTTGSDPHNISDTLNFIPQVESWYNFVGIYHRGSSQVYINGKLLHAKTSTGTVAKFCPGTQIIVGGWWNVDPESMNGKLDEIRLYNRVLATNEITQLARNFQPNSVKVRQTPVTQTIGQ